MKSCFTTFSLPEMTLREAVDLAVREGFPGLEIRGRGQIAPDSPEAVIADAARMLGDAGLEVPCVTGYAKFAQADRAGARAQAEEIARCAELAARLGAANVRAFMGAFPEGVEAGCVYDAIHEGLAYAAQAVHGSGVRILIETHDSMESGRQLAPVLAALPDDIGVLLDIAHPYAAGETVEETVRLVGSRIHHVHIKDYTLRTAEGFCYCEIGKGVLPVRETLRAMEAAGYTGYYCLEWEKSAEGLGGATFMEQMRSFQKVMKEEDDAAGI